MEQLSAERYHELYGTPQKEVKNQLQGKKNRRAGAEFENLIDRVCMKYSELMVAEIEKTPEPVKRITGKDKTGKFQAVNTKKAQPDYKGTLFGGRAVCFEAKQTEKDRIQRSAVTKEQLEKLINHHELGAVSFVLVSFDFRRFFKVPAKVWQDMKSIYGRQYLKTSDIPEYEVKVLSGYLDFLSRFGAAQGR